MRTRPEGDTHALDARRRTGEVTAHCKEHLPTRTMVWSPGPTWQQLMTVGNSSPQAVRCPPLASRRPVCVQCTFTSVQAKPQGCRMNLWTTKFPVRWFLNMPSKGSLPHWVSAFCCCLCFVATINKHWEQFLSLTWFQVTVRRGREAESGLKQRPQRDTLSSLFAPPSLLRLLSTIDSGGGGGRSCGCCCSRMAELSLHVSVCLLHVGGPWPPASPLLLLQLLSLCSHQQGLGFLHCHLWPWKSLLPFNYRQGFSV
jgi:hypothetical protein